MAYRGEGTSHNPFLIDTPPGSTDVPIIIDDSPIRPMPVLNLDPIPLIPQYMTNSEAGAQISISNSLQSQLINTNLESKIEQLRHEVSQASNQINNLQHDRQQILAQNDNLQSEIRASNEIVSTTRLRNDDVVESMRILSWC